MKQILIPAVMLTLVITVLTGLVYPLVVTGISQVLFPHQANGSLIEVNGKIIGSALIGQKFSKPEYFHGRPSAAGDGYDAANSGGTNSGTAGLGADRAEVFEAGVLSRTPIGGGRWLRRR